MIDEKIKLIHFGNDCASGIVINDILKIGEKQLFQLGLFKYCRGNEKYFKRSQTSFSVFFGLFRLFGPGSTKKG